MGVGMGGGMGVGMGVGKESFDAAETRASVPQLAKAGADEA